MITLQYELDGTLHLVNELDPAMIQNMIEGVLKGTPPTLMFYTPHGLLIVLGRPNSQIDLQLQDDLSMSDEAAWSRYMSQRGRKKGSVNKPHPHQEKPTLYAHTTGPAAIQMINVLIATGEFPDGWAWSAS
jgi:hypothetical protein